MQCDIWLRLTVLLCRWWNGWTRHARKRKLLLIPSISLTRQKWSRLKSKFNVSSVVLSFGLSCVRNITNLNSNVVDIWWHAGFWSLTRASRQPLVILLTLGKDSGISGPWLTHFVAQCLFIFLFTVGFNKYSWLAGVVSTDSDAVVPTFKFSSHPSVHPWTWVS